MKNLISMTDFVLEQNKQLKKAPEAYEQYCNIVNYANFLKQPLELWMFIPCDESGNVLVVNEYQHAKERCLFEGFKFDDMGFAYLPSKSGVGFDEEYMENKTIEDLVKYNLQLTEKAIKQLGL